MTKKLFKTITDHVWEHREYYLRFDKHCTFDYPFYGGLKNKIGTASPEAVDAMQNIWQLFVHVSSNITNKKQFLSLYKNELNRLGESVK